MVEELVPEAPAPAERAPEGLGLRERKKQRTRQALVRAALRLFTTKGYERTTLAEIAAAADIAPRTFFSYFAGKEDVVFFDVGQRRARALAVIAAREPGETVSDLLSRAVEQALFSPDTGIELLMDLAPARDALLAGVPALQARELHLAFDIQRELAEALHSAYPDLDLTDAQAAIGAVYGAVQMTAAAAIDRGDTPQQVRVAVRRGCEIATGGIQALDARTSQQR